ncbi:Aminotransferase, class III [hydrothermal vent metagenome]|uniref:Aminotransferase, class III n=1 Tax=hydrothermal vent metagenome TaxID=652676 RepID=A0A3B0UAP9_9ZZZZ
MSGHIFGRHTKSQLPVVGAGDGIWLIDKDGKKYLDGCGGAAISSLGHSNRNVLTAAKEQLDQIAFAHTGFFTSEPAELLADKLIELAPAGIERVYLVSGGSEAVEAAIKLARQYFVETGHPERSQVISRWQSYHGNTLGALAAGGNRWRRAQFAPLLSEAMHHIEPCHYWRWGQSGESEFDYGQRMANQLESKIIELGADRVAAFFAEPVVGATMGAVPAVAGYFKRIREICDHYGVLLILDEVMCGAGRTGTFFASEQEDIVPDMVCMAKGLGAGVQAIGAMLCSEKIFNAIRDGSGFFQHGHTYMGHPVAAATALAVIREIEQQDLLSNVQEMGKYLKDALNARFGQNPFVGDIRGRGLFFGLELVADKETKKPFDPALALHKKVKKAAMDNGLMCYPFGGTVDGRSGDHILLAPPYIITSGEIDILVDRLDLALSTALKQVGTS